MNAAPRFLAISLVLWCLNVIVAAGEVHKPRTWRDVSGKFEVQAALVEAKYDEKTKDTLVTLQKTDGTQVVVPLRQLHADDRAHVQRAAKVSSAKSARPKTQAAAQAAPATSNRTVPIRGSRIIYVTPSGDDKNSGASLEQSLRTPNAAVALASPGTVVCFDAGTYPPMKISDKKGSPDEPIVFQTVPGKERQATFTSGKREGGTGIEVELSSYIEIRNLRVADSQKGIACSSVSHCVIQGNLVENLGQEGLHVGRKRTYDGSQKFLGPDSENVQVIDNTVQGTGKVTAQYGEGIYIGTGAFRGDHTHDILIEDNRVSDISAEGAELKPGTYNITFRGNLIWNTHSEYSGALTVAVEGSDTRNGNYIIEDNLIWDVRKVKHSVSGIAIGHGDAVIRNNIIWGIEGGVGVHVYQTFSNPQALSILIVDNTICAGPGRGNILLHSGTGGGPPSPLKAIVQVKNTYTGDGAAGSVMADTRLFQGPFSGSADAGQGPGSGFRLLKKRGIGADYDKIRK